MKETKGTWGKKGTGTRGARRTYRSQNSAIFGGNVPQIYPTNIAPYSKYYCPVHIVHFTETAQYED